jgi:hypothetical protein
MKLLKKMMKKIDVDDGEEQIRNDLVLQLRDSLQTSRKNMYNDDLSIKERQQWTQVHTNTALVLNTILRDVQFRDWEKRMKILEEHGLLPDSIETNAQP